MNSSCRTKKPVRELHSGRDEPFSPIRYPSDLPIVEHRGEILGAIAENQVVVITGETGSGKSTQIPKMCLEAGRGARGMIGCTQPRRIAAVTLADRVSEELAETGPRRVGYKIRFHDRTTRSTRIKFMTDGILLAEAQSDRHFRAYDTLVIDEAHERTLNIDFLLGLIKRILPRRPELKVIITSATIDPGKFSKAFQDAPIIEVSGRTYPVDVRYRPPANGEGPEADAEDITHIDQAVAATDELKGSGQEGRRGDILVFMPTESDIRETVQRLDEKRYFNTVVIPLFGRMAAADQKRVFLPTTEDKIIVATNVAETSITIPRIKYVIDTGLARVSQYNTRSRTQSLPVARVSRASADQRKGRCGRVEAGICIRLYSVEDYLARPLYTAPEILRSNLAEVILRMLFLRLGSIQEFPFLDPPSPSAVKDGFAVLRELGAVDEHRRLTAMGRVMARLPLDPRLSRMLLQAREEGAVTELTILAAALSVQDPRERPLDKETQADQAHAVFRDTRSDFVTLLKIWEKCWPRCEAAIASSEARPQDPDRGAAANGPTRHDVALGTRGENRLVRYASRSQSQLRKFCREHFLSYRRMREWRDVWEEIREILEEMGGFPENSDPAGYEAIHRSVVSGYLSHIAMRKEKNIYTGTKNRQVMLFPGSGLFNRGGAWVTAAEVVQTTRLFARMAANVDPEWLERLGGHLCRSTVFEPHWERKRGQVTAFERVTLYGLPVVDRRKVNFGAVRPAEARDIFIRSALIEYDVPKPYGFLDHNRDLVRQIEEIESKTRRRDLLVDEETVFRFYDRRLPAICELRSLDKWIKDHGGDHFLRMTESDILRTEPDFGELELFPDRLKLEDVELPLRYAFRPGEEDDGITATVPVHVLPRLAPQSFEWLVPGMLAEKLAILLKGLPKSQRRQLVPVGETAARLIEMLRRRSGDFHEQLSLCVRELAGVSVPVDQWRRIDLPPHLRMRLEITGPEGNLLGVGRDLLELKSLAVEKHEDRLWEQARAAWEREGLTSWSFGELPERVPIGKDALGLTRYAYPGLVAEGQTAAVRLYAEPEEATRASAGGLRLLFELTFGDELKYFRRDWTFSKKTASMLFFMGGREEAVRCLHDYILRELFELDAPGLPSYGRFYDVVRRLTGRLGAAARALLDEVEAVIGERESTRSEIERYKRMAEANPAAVRCLLGLSRELVTLVPGNFLVQSGSDRMRELPRYLKALRLRAERAYAAPEKDRLKAGQIAPYEKHLEEMRTRISEHSEESPRRLYEEYRTMLEEFKISLFAPEIKTRFRISAKRLDEKLEEWKPWKAVD
ncbi:ATP-dependent RNA helicase HrpA [Syntrophobacter fumaroxidans]|uniref:ATP-dependent helicase HrpA n=1 Tax=Syntrophobacter fumaroxidans (strain DSM 10017 / MPOB) TaxID=335543 RepID=A0LMI5_SYNFM|nr:ATP-dependent RNA helicase HrpA [Syntrophobacter fumaroxidans]ABK18637.1 ATP-dependent helicase HrpA [Syntrophobacter fumaroxidans MPOB]